MHRNVYILRLVAGFVFRVVSHFQILYMKNEIFPIFLYMHHAKVIIRKTSIKDEKIIGEP